MRSLALAVVLGAAAFLSPASAQAPCVNGKAGSFDCQGVDLLAQLTPAALGGTCVTAQTNTGPVTFCANDIWGWTDPDTGIEYALVGAGNGTVFVSLADPTAPEVLGLLPTSGQGNVYFQLWRDIKTYQHYALIVSERASHGVQVFDLHKLRGLGADPTRRFTADALYTGVGSSHNIVVNEATGYAYAVGARTQLTNAPASCAARGFHAISLQTPTSPTFAGCFSDVDVDVTFGGRQPGYTHDAQCVVYEGPDADYTGRELCVGSNENTVAFFDVTDKAAVRVISQGSYPQTAYAHQGWLTPDHRYFLADDELDEVNGLVRTQRTMLFDVSDLDDPELIGIYDSGLPAIDHNQYVVGQYSFQSNYESGLRVLDLANLASGTLREVAFFDTYPQGTSISFDGQWSNYPYFKSGIVIANDDPNGLFVLQPDVMRPAVVEPLPTGLAFELTAPTPNPVVDRATLRLRVAEDQTVTVTLVDVQGREVGRLFEGTALAGRPVRLNVDGGGLAAGVYVVRVVGEAFETSQRVTIAR